MYFLRWIKIDPSFLVSGALVCTCFIFPASVVQARQTAEKQPAKETVKEADSANAEREEKLAALKNIEPNQLTFPELDLLLSNRSDEQIIEYFEQNFADKSGVRPQKQGGWIAEILEQRKAWPKAISLRQQIAKQAEQLGREHWSAKLSKALVARTERIAKLDGAQQTTYLKLRKQTLELIDWSEREPWYVDLKRAEWEEIAKQLKPFQEVDPFIGMVVSLHRIESVLAWGEERERSLDELKELEQGFHKILGKSPMLARCHAAMARALGDLGRYEESLEQGAKSLRIYRQCDTEKANVPYCFAAFQKAGIHFELGQVPQSHRILRQIIEDCKVGSDLQKLVCYQCHIRLAANHRAMREDRRSNSHMAKADAIVTRMKERIAGTDEAKGKELMWHWMDRTNGFIEGGAYALRVGQSKLAVTLFYINVKLKTERNTNKEETVFAYYHMAVADIVIGEDLERAERSIARALNVSKEWGKDFMFVEILMLQAEIAKRRKDLPGTLESLQKINDFYRNHEGLVARRGLAAIQSLFVTYDTQWKLKRSKDALATNLESLEMSYRLAVDQLPQLSSYGQQEGWLNQLGGGMEHLLAMTDESDPAMTKKAIKWTSMVKGIGTESERQVLRQMQKWATSTDRSELVKNLCLNRSKLVHILLHDSKRIGTRKAEVQTILDDLEKSQNNVLAELNQAFQNKLFQRSELPVDQWLEEVPVGTAYVDFWLASEPQFWTSVEKIATARQLVAMVVWKPAENETTEIRLVRLSKYAKVESEVNQWRLLLSNEGRPGLSDQQKADLEQELLASSERLYSQVWEKLVPHISDMEKVIICPVESLWEVPFSALRDPKSKQFLVERHQLASVHSTQQFIEILGKAFQRPQSPIVIGGLEYGRTESIGDADETTFAFRQLDHSMEELDSVGRDSLWGNSAKRLSGQGATESTVADAITNRQYDMVHFATHAFALAVDEAQLGKLNRRGDVGGPIKRTQIEEVKGPAPYALGSSLRLRTSGAFSGIALSGVNEAKINDKDDQVLSAVEIETLDLSHLQFVVLSGCETGRGFVNRNEGVFGLQRSFYLAGVPSSLGTYWEVDDGETLKTMDRFYSHFEQQEKATALTLTQRELIKAGKPISVWAAWQLFGDWR